MPQARVLFLSSAYAAPVLEHHPDIDEVLCVDGHESFRDLVRLFRSGEAPAALSHPPTPDAPGRIVDPNAAKSLGKGLVSTSLGRAGEMESGVKIDAAIFLKPFRRLMAAARLARVPVRVGTGYRWYSWLLTRRIYEHRSDFAQHESAYNMGLLRGLDLAPGDPTRPQLVVTAQERHWAKTYLGPAQASRVVVHPGGFSSRTWKAGHFQDLIQELARLGCEVLLTGSIAESEHFRNETNGAEWPESVRDLMGALSLRELMAVVAESDVLVSMSSGPMHMAAALDVPTVSLFDPRRNQSPTRWQSLGTGIVLMPDVPTCERCIYEACPYWDCLDRITAQTVIRQVQQVLASKSTVEASVAVARV